MTTASKEGAKAARESLEKLSDSLTEEERTKRSAYFVKLEEFIDDAERRLPTMAAIKRDALKNRYQ